MKPILLLLAVAACTEHGSGGGPVEPEPTDAVETTPFFPLLCEASCPINTVILDDIGASGVQITFAARAVGAVLSIEDVAMSSTRGVFHVDHPAFLTIAAGGQPILTSDPFAGLSIELFPGDPPTQLEGTVNLGAALASDRVVIRFDSIGEDQI